MDGSACGTAVLQYFEEKDEIVGINDHVIMSRLKGPDDAGQTAVITTAKLSARADDRMLALWAAPGLLATSSSETMVRFWNLLEDENYVVRVSDCKVPPDDTIESIAFNPHKRLLAAGTRKGFVLFWLFSSEQGSSSADDWHPLNHATAKLDASVTDLKWAPAGGVLYAGTDKCGFMLIEHELQRKVRDGVVLVQESNQRVGFLHALRQRDSYGAADIDLEAEDVQRFWAGELVKGAISIAAASTAPQTSRWRGAPSASPSEIVLVTTPWRFVTSMTPSPGESTAM
jgi:hypothetical protein